MNAVLVIAAAFVVGALLALAGAVLQNVLRNPLAEPYMLGLVGGSALGVSLVLRFGLVALGAWVLPAASAGGAALSLALTCAVAYGASRARARAGTDAQMRSALPGVVLAGFAVASLTCSLQMLVMAGAEDALHAQLARWLYGTLAGVTPGLLALGAGVLVVVAGVLGLAARALNVLELGRDEAECLGLDTRRALLVALACASLATAAAVALAGAIGFLGLVVPHVVRRFTGPRLQRLLPAAAFAGGIFLIVAEGVGRVLPGNLSAGIVCALLGAPVFLVLLAVHSRGEGRDV